LTSVRYEDFSQRLVEQIPEFADALREHQEYYGETLNHVLVGELVRFLTQIYSSSNDLATQPAAHLDTVARILAFIEQAASSEDEKVMELIQVSLMESLYLAGPYYEPIVSRLGPNSRKLLDAALDA
jgi:hypothetical protein